jgi:hypothetical protein
MDYTYQPKQSSKRMVAIAAVLALHIFIVYALVTGLARKAVDVIKKPLEAKIVEEVKLPPPPPPPPPLPPPPKTPNLPPPPPAAPPPPYVPPVEVAVAAPPAPAITTTSEPPKAEYKIEPPPPPAPPAPAAPVPAPPPPKPALTRIGFASLPQPCRPDSPPVREMNKAGIDRIEGTILATINGDGSISNVRAGSVNPGSMRTAVQRTFSTALTDPACRTKAEGEKYEVEIPFTMKLD